MRGNTPRATFTLNIVHPNLTPCWQWDSIVGWSDIDLGRALRAFAVGSALGLLALASLPNQSRGQSGGPYLVRRATIDGGGATSVAGGAFRAGVTLGQPDAGSANATGYSIGGGFWRGGTLVAAPTPTASLTPTPSRSATAPASATQTPTVPPTRTPTIPVGVPTNTPSRTGGASVTPVRTPTATPTVIASATPSASPATVTATPSPTATATQPETTCAGDCDNNGRVSVDELVRGVNIALERAALSLCPAMNSNGDARITVNELITAVNAALGGC